MSPSISSFLAFAAGAVLAAALLPAPARAETPLGALGAPHFDLSAAATVGVLRTTAGSAEATFGVRTSLAAYLVPRLAVVADYWTMWRASDPTCGRDLRCDDLGTQNMLTVGARFAPLRALYLQGSVGVAFNRFDAGVREEAWRVGPVVGAALGFTQPVGRVQLGLELRGNAQVYEGAVAYNGGGGFTVGTVF